ncbi:FAD/NAD(P)-binding domain-containing protein [Cucurbitaria berberidis CBS 394.84]|uniref:FAD/NAD(P)-binding domain-containing protein n=1 Tax=Cucurbitaria berberidis CBS 394.84 TaxID=1168544 RepID=A0A9P4G7S3_9PLEO|nr:FAD/NAD(P)-binding domain-containing protein [Cucurbitaria berberidis CBS 394.84]KAF1840569.1 FAD/NAD(P)-binding domain-containing protein [Cucurbitaria berberidis CBS 394.84]
MPSTTPTPKLAIIGAGPVSLTLANILQKNCIPFTIFEASPTFRTQGGSLDLHPESGQLALKEAGLWNQFMKHARPESDVMKIVSLDGEVLWDENGADKHEVKEDEKFNGRPEIDRVMLLKILSENLKSDNVQLGRKLQEIVPSVADGSKYDLHFADGTQETAFDLVVGGDGAWSKVRNLLSDTKPDYSGISAVEFWCHDIKKNPWLLDYIGEGSMMALGEGCAVQAQRQGDGSLRAYAALRVPEDFLETCGINWSDTDNARIQYVERYFSHICNDLKRIVLESPDGLFLRPLYELPVGFTWPSRSGITLIGDAAHVFTPYAGEGVNVGMNDALVLAREIANAYNNETDLGEATRAYEQEMFPRAAKAAAKTMRGKINHFSANGGKEFADMFKAHYYGSSKAGVVRDSVNLADTMHDGSKIDIPRN